MQSRCTRRDETKLCAHYIYLTECTTYDDIDGNTFNIQESINCKTFEVSYCMYVGQTGDNLYQRMVKKLFSPK